MTPQQIAELLSPAALRVLAHAARRDGMYVCPTRGLHAAASMAVLNMLHRLGLTTGGGSPVLTELGRQVAAVHLGCKEWE